MKNHRITGALLTGLLFFLTGVHPSMAQMQALSDQRLDAVTAQAGFSMHLDLSARINPLHVALTEEDGDRLTLQEISIHGQAGNPIALYTPAYGPFTLDIGPDGYLLAAGTLFTDPINLEVNPIFLNDTNLGSLEVDYLDFGSGGLQASARFLPSLFIDMDVGFQLHGDSLAYGDETAEGSLALSGIHLSGSATGDPEDPGSWGYGGMFQMSKTVSVVSILEFIESIAEWAPEMQMSTVSGSLRVENMRLGTQDFGPMAIDNIRTHRLSMLPGL